MNSLILIGATVLAIITSIATLFLLLKFRWPAPAQWFIKSGVAAISPVLAVIGWLTMLLGLLNSAVGLVLISLYTALVFTIYYIRVTNPPERTGSFESAFGANWDKQLQPGQKKFFLPRRILLKLPPTRRPRFEQNIVFATLPGTNRKLLCDIWQPPVKVRPSGLAFIYLHGSAYYLLDKDFKTRPLFRRLASQGHVIMDVAYRLAPETNMMGMVHDVQRAIAWMKEHADDYGVDRKRIVLGGGSAGGHLALLTAYTAHDHQFKSKDLDGKEISVRAVVSLYGPADLTALYEHTNQHLATLSNPGQPGKKAPMQMPSWIAKGMGSEFHRLGFDKGFENAGLLAPILGGSPDECPEVYDLFSPIHHVHSSNPPTLLIHGHHDIMVPVASTIQLHAQLKQNHVPVVMHILPQTDHAFDLILPTISPSAHTAFYDVERFLALFVKNAYTPVHPSKKMEEHSLTYS
jgi:acetyl esterase/lipase